MGRKNLFGAFSGDELTAVNSPDRAGEATTPGQTPLTTAIGSRGAIGAVSRSIEQMRSNAIAELAPELIEASAISDRLEGTPEEHRALVASIREHGQQVPILVRPHPLREGRYQIAYGRRRLRALTELGRSVRAIVKPLSDAQLVVAQGQENSARTDLSFIEKALFAAKLEEGGYDRETIMAALSVDKTVVSRLISAAVKIPRPVIEQIGPAPKAGRDRWNQLALRLETKAALDAVEGLLTSETFAAKTSDDRFAAVFAAAAPRPVKSVGLVTVKTGDGTRLARINEDERSLSLALDKKEMGGFAAYLVDALPDLYATFKRRADQTDTDRKDRSNP